jgi:hypothetical protein
MAANDHISNHQFHMHLYHGTSSNNLERIQAAGLGGNVGHTPNVYVTHDFNLAHYYADTAVDEEGGDPIVLTVRVNPRRLSTDYNSFAEPVYATDWDAEPRSFDESKLRKGMESEDWKNSLRETGSAEHFGKIEPKNVIRSERVPHYRFW